MIRRSRPGDGVVVTCSNCDWERSSASDLAVMSGRDHAQETGHRLTVKDEYDGTESISAT